MNNWMEKFERTKDEAREKELNRKLNKLLDLLDETYRDDDRIKVIDNIIKVYDLLRIDACDFDYNDYINKKKQLVELKYKIKKKEHMESKESKSWNEFRDEELEEEER